MVSIKVSPEVEAFNAKPVPEGFWKARITQAEGPTLRFHGRQIATEEAKRLAVDLWETPAGAWIAVRTEIALRDGEHNRVEAHIIPPCDDEAARRIEVMDFLRWSLPARSMARRLGWHLDRIVE